VPVALKIGYKDLNSQPWFHGSISADESEKLLLAEPNREGAFLVRNGTPAAIRTPEDAGMMVSFRTAQATVLHYGMKLHPKGGYMMEAGPAFETPVKLISFYSGGGCTIGANNTTRTSLRRALTRTRSRRPSLSIPETPRPKDLGYVLVSDTVGGVAVQRLESGGAGQGFGQIGYYQQHWMKRHTAVGGAQTRTRPGGAGGVGTAPAATRSYSEDDTGVGGGGSTCAGKSVLDDSSAHTADGDGAQAAGAAARVGAV
jgi:hypothetical protein